MPLTPKQQMFIEEYLTCWNASEAARRAGYSERSLRSIASETLAKPDIQAEIKRRLNEATMTADEVLMRLTQMARSQYSKYYTEAGTVDLATMKQDNMMHLIKGIKPTKHGKEVTFYDGQKALVDLGRHHKQFTDQTDITSGGQPIKVSGINVSDDL